MSMIVWLVVEVGVQKILGSIEQLRTRVDGTDQDLQFLSDLLASSQLQSLIEVYFVTPITAVSVDHFGGQVDLPPYFRVILFCKEIKNIG